MANSARDTISVKKLLEVIKKLVPFQQAVILTTVPRGGLQICQPAKLPAGLIKAYAQGAHAEDRLSWQSILRKKPTQPSDIGSREAFAGSVYSRELMIPSRSAYVVAFPLAAPIFLGYPGSLHLLRTKEQGAFTASQIASVMSAIKAFDQRVANARAPKKGAEGSAALAAPAQSAGLKIFDAKMRVLYGNDAWTSLDGHLKNHISEYAKRRFQQLNNHGVLADRAQFPDKQSNVWVYRMVTCKRYPALGDGPISFLCPQPACTEWMGLKPADFAADPEISRLIPAIKFMQKTFRHGPSLVSIANAADLSAFHFHRRFTELLGMTPKQFMLDCQIRDAKLDLLGGKVELADIARACGFSHQSHFTSRFRQATGHTPRRWRHLATSSARPVASSRSR